MRTKIARRERLPCGCVSKALFDTLAGCKKVRKTSSARPSAYRGTAGRALRRKSKSSKIACCAIKYGISFFYKSKHRKVKTYKKKPILTITDVFDSLAQGTCSLRVLRYTNAAPSALQAAVASSSGASQQVTLSQARTAPSVLQVSSHVRIHSPSPQP